MNELPYFLNNYLKITVPKIDLMIDAAIKNGALGAKIVGSGGGGSIVALATNKNEKKIMNAILEAGAKNVYIASIEKGASIK
jgi:galactokinase